MTDTVQAHECQWGELETSRLAGTTHRKCQVSGCKMINPLDDDDTVPFGNEPEPEVVKPFGKVIGRGVRHGRIAQIMPNRDGVLLRIDDERNDEFWLDVELSHEELATLLLQCAEESR